MFARQARHRARVQADLRRSIFAVAVIGDADAERDIVEAPALGKVVADVVDLLPALLGLNLFGGQWR
jgi:hypothetical protein